MQRKHQSNLSAAVALTLVFIAPAANAGHTGSNTLDSSSASSIITDSAIPLQDGRWSIYFRTETVSFDRLSNGELLELREADSEADLHSVDTLQTSTLGIGYGVTENLTLGFTLPYLDRDDIREPPHADGEHGHSEEVPDDHDHEARGVESLGDSRGIGDATVFGLWRFKQAPDRQTHVSALFGFKAPTGRTSQRTHEGGRFEAELQPGSGSWDGFLGLATSIRFGKLQWESSVRYTAVTEGSQDTDLGDIANYNVGLAYPLLATNTNARFFNLVLELNGEWRDRLEIRDVEDRNSGGHTLFAAPGINVGGERWGVSASVGIPVVDNPYGDQDERDYRFLVGLRWNP